ncbi:MAG TPA: hypothetical protein VEJ84_23505, partial [Acidimicrobiales bacterium]|nr:hypothetical protein [Acidimicrobiales bacterium]
GDPQAGTTYLSGTLTGLIATVVAGRRPDAGAAISLTGIIAGAAAGVALLDTVPNATPFLAVLAVGLTAALSWKEHCGAPDRYREAATLRSPARTDPCPACGRWG